MSRPNSRYVLWSYTGKRQKPAYTVQNNLNPIDLRRANPANSHLCGLDKSTSKLINAAVDQFRFLAEYELKSAAIKHNQVASTRIACMCNAVSAYQAVGDKSPELCLWRRCSCTHRKVKASVMMLCKYLEVSNFKAVFCKLLCGGRFLPPGWPGGRYGFRR